MSHERAAEESPELDSLAIQNAQPKQYARKRGDSVDDTVVLWFGELLRSPPQRQKHALVVLSRTVNGSHDRLVAFDKQSWIHPRLEVESADGVIA